MNDTYGITMKSYHLLLHTLAEFPEIESAILFGSRAKGTFRHGSDIDIAIRGKACSPQIAMQVSSKLNENLPIPYFFDIVHYDSLQQTSFIEHIDRVGIVIYEKK